MSDLETRRPQFTPTEQFSDEFLEPEPVADETVTALSELEFQPKEPVIEPELPLDKLPDFSPEPEQALSQEIITPDPPKPTPQPRRQQPEPALRQPTAPQTTNSTTADQLPSQVPIWPGSSVSEYGIGGSNDGAEAHSSNGAEQNVGGDSALQAYLSDSFGYINRHIRNNLVYPAQARRAGQSGTVIIEFTIQMDGRARDINVTGSSGFDILDNGAIRAVEKASPFPSPPKSTRIVVQVEFNLR